MAERIAPFKRLLVHLNTTATSQPAFRRALMLARASRASIRLVDVLPQVPAPGGTTPAFVRLVREKMLDHLAEATAEARTADVPTTSMLLDAGDEAATLIKAAVSWKADVLLRSHAVHGGVAHPAGPVDSQILRRCPCPVWLVTPRQADGERVVVAAVDPEPQDAVRHGLAVRVAGTAIRLAGETGAALHLVHAWTAFGHQILASRASRKDLLAHQAACRDHAAARFEALRKDAAVPDTAKMHLIEGLSEKVLAEAVASRRAGVVVLGTIGRTGLAGLVVGNTAEHLVRQVSCSVLALKPAGFGAASPEGLIQA
jgi:universal stress protein E